MLVTDPLLEEAAFIAAAVREGSLSARRVAALAHARASGSTAWVPPNLEALLEDADTIDREIERGASLPLAGVPFIVSGMVPQILVRGLVRAGSLRIQPAGANGLVLKGAADAVTRGVAALAVVAGAGEEELAACGTHVLLPADLGYAFLARSSRDLALAADAAMSAQPGEDILCRPLTGVVGQGAARLQIGVAGEAARRILPPSLRNSARITSSGAAEAVDAFVFTGSRPSDGAVTARLYVPVNDTAVGIQAKEIAVAVRVGSVIDAAQLAGV